MFSAVSVRPILREISAMQSLGKHVRFICMYVCMYVYMHSLYCVYVYLSVCLSVCINYLNGKCVCMYTPNDMYGCMYVWCVQTNAPNLYPWELIRRVGCSPPTPTHLSVGSWARSCMCAGSTLLWFSLKIVAHSFIHSRIHIYIHKLCIHTYMRINMCILTLEHSLIHTYMHAYIHYK